MKNYIRIAISLPAIIICVITMLLYVLATTPLDSIGDIGKEDLEEKVGIKKGELRLANFFAGLIIWSYIIYFKK